MGEDVIRIMSTFGVPADIGGHWLHGFSANQIAEFGKKHKDKFKIYKDPDRDAVYDGKRKVSGKELWKLYKQIKEIKNTSVSARPLIDLIPEK